jgi:hypothetical protein
MAPLCLYLGHTAGSSVAPPRARLPQSVRGMGIVAHQFQRRALRDVTTRIVRIPARLQWLVICKAVWPRAVTRVAGAPELGIVVAEHEQGLAA